MSTTFSAVAATTAATALIKKTLDEVYSKVKEKGVNYLARARSDVKDITIARALVNVTKVKTLWNFDKEISLYQFYYPASILMENNQRKEINGLRDLGGRKNYVIQGTAGQGKSIFLRYLCGQELFSEATSNRVPIFVELRRVNAEFNVARLILEALKRYKLPNTEASWNYLAETGKFILILDAFDEIDPQLASRTVGEIEDIADMYEEQLQIIVTSRPDADIQRSAKFRVLKLASLESKDHQRFLETTCSDKHQAQNLVSVIETSTTEIRGLLTTPLMMTLLVFLYKAIQSIPDTVPKFYEELFDVLFYRHDNSKPGFRRKRFTHLDDSKIKKLFSAFCFYVRLAGLGTLTSEQLRKCVEDAAKVCNESIDPDKFRDELTKTVCLMQQDGFEYSFIHRSVAQYYAASFISNSSENFAEAFYRIATKRNKSWDLELRFLAEIDSYKYIKLYEIPMLNKIAADIGHSFSSYNDRVEVFVKKFCLEKISLVLRDSWENKGAKINGDKNEVTGWSINSDDDNYLMDFLGPEWAGQIIGAAKNDEVFQTEIAKIIKSKSKSKLNISLRAPCEMFAIEIDEKLPNLSKEIVNKLQKRYERAMLVIKIEDEKTAMLTAML